MCDRRSVKRRGIMMTDAVLGLALLAMVAALLAVTVARHVQANERLAGSRAAMRYAERVAGDLQLGQAPPASEEHARWQVKPLDAPAPRGQVWVEVRVTTRGREATLVAVVPASAAPKEAP
jgi:hypothetical protein